MIRQFGSIFAPDPEPQKEIKTEVDRMHATWDAERIDPFSMPGHDGLEPSQVAEKNRDVQRLEEEWGKTSDIAGNRLKRSRNLEFVIYHDLEQKNWLKEDERYDELMGDDKGFFLRSFPAAKYDDYHHGIDTICVINNADTGFESVPFAIDPTSDIREGRIAHHLNTPYKDINNRRIRDYNNIKGLTSVTFFKDKTHPNDESYPKGSIPLLPRFVVGFDDDMAKQISGLESLQRSRPVAPGAEWSTIMSSIEDERFENWGDFSRKTPEEISDRLRELEQRANWIVVHELSAQADKLRESLSLIRNPDENIQKIRRHLDSLKKYFDGAKRILNQETPPRIRTLCENDPVYQSIIQELGR